jgi:hypothetical protein
MKHDLSPEIYRAFQALFEGSRHKRRRPVSLIIRAECIFPAANFGSDMRYALAEHEDKLPALVPEKPDPTITKLWQNITTYDCRAMSLFTARKHHWPISISFSSFPRISAEGRGA